tara:strand:+ start:52 stop:2505 length:2454 start_codon:yes stop_codon:yes gene_type:complete
MQNGFAITNVDGVYFNTRITTPAIPAITYDGTDIFAKGSGAEVNLTSTTNNWSDITIDTSKDMLKFSLTNLGAVSFKDSGNVVRGSLTADSTNSALTLNIGINPLRITNVNTEIATFGITSGDEINFFGDLDMNQNQIWEVDSIVFDAFSTGNADGKSISTTSGTRMQFDLERTTDFFAFKIGASNRFLIGNASIESLKPINMNTNSLTGVTVFSMNTYSGTAPTGNGNMWSDGTDIKVRSGGAERNLSTVGGFPNPVTGTLDMNDNMITNITLAGIVDVGSTSRGSISGDSTQGLVINGALITMLDVTTNIATFAKHNSGDIDFYTDLDMHTYDITSVDRLKLSTVQGSGTALLSTDTGIEALYSGVNPFGMLIQFPSTNGAVMQIKRGTTDMINISSLGVLFGDELLMGGHKISNVLTPTASSAGTDVATKDYVLANAGGSQTPWTSTINADNNPLIGANYIQFNNLNQAVNPANTVPFIQFDNFDMTFNIPTGKGYEVNINGDTLIGLSGSLVTINSLGSMILKSNTNNTIQMFAGSTSATHTFQDNALSLGTGIDLVVSGNLIDFTNRATPTAGSIFGNGAMYSKGGDPMWWDGTTETSMLGGGSSGGGVNNSWIWTDDETNEFDEAVYLSNAVMGRDTQTTNAVLPYKDTVYWVPIYFSKACTINAIGLQFTTAGSGSMGLMYGLYDTYADQKYPKSLVDGGSSVGYMGTGLGGNFTLTTSFAVPSAGLYFIAIKNDTNTGSAFRVQGGGSTSPTLSLGHYYVSGTSNGFMPITGYFSTEYGNLPSTAQIDDDMSVTYYGGTNIPLIFVRVS